MIGARLRNGSVVKPPMHVLVLEREPMRIPDRVGGSNDDRGRKRLAPVGRPLDVYGDVVVSVARVRAMR